jgi:hypothetical protein
MILTLHIFHTEIRIRCRIDNSTVNFGMRFPSVREFRPGTPARTTICVPTIPEGPPNVKGVVKLAS